MRSNELLKYLSQQEKEDQVYSNMQTLKEDLTFLKMYVNRNTKSIFSFDIVPYYGMCRKFIKELYTQYYYNNVEEIDILLTEYEVVHKMFNKIDNDEINEELNNMIKDVYSYFEKHYEIDIREYVTDYVGCSRGCSRAVGIITSGIQ